MKERFEDGGGGLKGGLCGMDLEWGQMILGISFLDLVKKSQWGSREARIRVGLFRNKGKNIQRYQQKNNKRR